MPTLNQVAQAFGSTRDAYNGWERNGHIHTRVAPTMPGVARQLSRQNILEIGFLAAFTRCGVAPPRAVPFVASFIRQDQDGLGSIREWFAFRAGEARPTEGWALDRLDQTKLEECFGRDEFIFTIIRAGEIVRLTNALMEA